jgi:hypothetical protein
MPGSLHLGKIAGIEISIHVSWLIIVVLLTWSRASGWSTARTGGGDDSRLMARVKSKGET